MGSINEQAKESLKSLTQNFSKINAQIEHNKGLLGSVHDYKAQIPTPSSLGASSDIWLWDFIGDVEIIGKYINYLLTGPALGNRYQIQAGWCPNGATKNIIVDNVPSGAVHIPGVPAYTLGNTNLRGLVPGILEDMWQINPDNLLKMMQGKGEFYQECFTTKNFMLEQILE